MRFKAFITVLFVLPWLLGNIKDDTIRCSMINLIASPERFDKRKIQTIGVARVGFEADFLYLTLEDARDTVMLNGVRLAFDDSKISESDKKKLNLRRVLVSGVFHRSQANDGLGAGGISDISQIFALEDVKVE